METLKMQLNYLTADLLEDLVTERFDYAEYNKAFNLILKMLKMKYEVLKKIESAEVTENIIFIIMRINDIANVCRDYKNENKEETIKIIEEKLKKAIEYFDNFERIKND